ncbi:MAG: hypothetical protein IAF94_23305 [Pirellulaceae bacterium]|nr:hypothetical protein [Pirellulaceae bacterium]
MLVLTFLLAVILAAFRLHPAAGVFACMIGVGLTIVVARTKSAIRRHQALWNELQVPDCIRKEQAALFSIWSFFTVLLASFFFFSGVFVAFAVGVVFVDNYLTGRSPYPRLSSLHPWIDIVFLVFVFGLPTLIASGFLWATWPRVPQSRAGHGPSDKTG